MTKQRTLPRCRVVQWLIRFGQISLLACPFMNDNIAKGDFRMPNREAAKGTYPSEGYA